MHKNAAGPIGLLQNDANTHKNLIGQSLCLNLMF